MGTSLLSSLAVQPVSPENSKYLKTQHFNHSVFFLLCGKLQQESEGPGEEETGEEAEDLGSH